MPKFSRTSLQWFLPAALLGALMAAGFACGSSDTGAGATGCTPGAQTACACPGGTEQGIQVCSADGTAFGTCQCGDTSSSTTASGGPHCGDGVLDAAEGEACDDGNENNDDGCTIACQPPSCGDGIVEAGEDCDDGNSPEFDTCPDDCLNGGAGGAGAGGSGAGGDPCGGALIYAGMTDAQATPWTSTLHTGYAAGMDMCTDLGADHVCEYQEVQQALAAGELNADPNLINAGAAGLTAWVHRTTDEHVGVDHHPNPAGALSAAGPGGRCNEWVYTTNHISDGEYVDLVSNGGVVSSTFWIDNDTFYDGVNTSHQIPDMLQCGGTSRRILCCYAKCE